MRLDGGIAIVTGASRGLGARLCEHLARRGMKLLLTARSAGDLDETAERVRALGGRALPLAADVTVRGDLERIAATAEDELGPVDLLVNNAGVEWVARFHEMEPDLIERTVQTNLTSAQLLTRFVLPPMVERRRGHILNMSSLSGKTAYPYLASYSATKHGLVGFSWSLREELKPLGIGVSVVCPTFVTETGMFARRHPEDDLPPRVNVPVTPDDVARACIRAVERNKAEVLVAKGLAKVVDVFHAVSPSLTTWLPRRTGLYRYIEKELDEG